MAMKYIDEYRDSKVARALIRKIEGLSKKSARIMEICGTHTMAIFKHGIRSLLPANIDLVSGPGCPVCVTAAEEIDQAVKLAKIPGVIVTTFGDMMRVPGSHSSLQDEKAKGADVRMVYSTFDALKIAGENPEKNVVFLGIGFETTAPTIAAAVMTAHKTGAANFSILSAHKLLPPAMEALLSGGHLEIDGFMCPGHVTTIIGTKAYEWVADHYGKPCVVTGFEPVDILQGIFMLIDQIEEGRAEVEMQYRRGASAAGNPGALRAMDEVFVTCDSPWRGLGPIPGSGLTIRKKYRAHDAKEIYDLDVPPAKEPPGCLCGEVLRGTAKPVDCKFFKNSCTPKTPIGPCMVSSEGTCAAYFKYGLNV